MGDLSVGFLYGQEDVGLLWQPKSRGIHSLDSSWSGECGDHSLV